MTEKKIILATMIGNALELYDFTLYAVMAPVLSKIFFPENNNTLSLITTLSIFAAGFLMRPLGAVVFGHLGDRIGRKETLVISILIIALSTFLMGIIPTYHSIGILAPLILLFCRLLQGLSMGSEFSGASVFLIEHFIKGKQGFAGGLVLSSALTGALLATLLGSLSINEGMPAWGWRLPFIIGGAAGIAGFYIRSNLKESPEFKKIVKVNAVEKLPLKTVLVDRLQGFLCGIGIGGAGGALSYSLVAYTNVYLNSVVDIKVEKAMFFNVVGLFVYTLVASISGYMSDKYGPKKTMTFFCYCSSLLAIPVFLLMKTGESFNIILAEFILGVMAGGFCGPQIYLIYTLFPTNIRYTGVSFSYGIGITIFGGTFPLIATLLINVTDNPVLPGLYLSGCSIIGWIAVKQCKRYQLDLPIENKSYNLSAINDSVLG